MYLVCCIIWKYDEIKIWMHINISQRVLLTKPLQVGQDHDSKWKFYLFRTWQVMAKFSIIDFRSRAENQRPRALQPQCGILCLCMTKDLWLLAIWIRLLQTSTRETLIFSLLFCCRLVLFDGSCLTLSPHQHGGAHDNGAIRSRRGGCRTKSEYLLGFEK